MEILEKSRWDLLCFSIMSKITTPGACKVLRMMWNPDLLIVNTYSGGQHSAKKSPLIQVNLSPDRNGVNSF